MKRFVLLLLTATLCLGGYGQDVYAPYRQHWLEQAQRYTPVLQERVCHPVDTVDIVPDSAAFQGWKAVPGSAVFDFGHHLTGYLTLRFRVLSGTQDAPLRACIRMGEIPAELMLPREPWTGTLSRAWLQDETVTVWDLSAPLTLSRRFSGRYLSVTFPDTPMAFSFVVDDVSLRAVSAAEEAPQVEGRIPQMALATLSECMQTVMEDGPKRDRRLWAGDFYLGMLANRYSFRNMDLVRRCLYLLAGCAAPDGTLNSQVYESPQPHPQEWSYAPDASLYFPLMLQEYLDQTSDLDLVRDLWPVAVKQLQTALGFLDARSLFHPSVPVWQVFDWCEGLDRTTSTHGLLICALRQGALLAEKLGDAPLAEQWRTRAAEMQEAARRYLWKSGVFVSGDAQQRSVHSQIWMVLGDVVSGPAARRVLRRALSDPQFLRPNTPGAMHFLVEALIRCGMDEEARQVMRSCWGAMAGLGLDTFCEIWDADRPDASPYGHPGLNSYCHLWASTPLYFWGRYPAIFAGIR